MLKKLANNFVFFLPLLILSLIYMLSLIRPVDLAGQDLGRHLINGREILAGHWSVLKTNFYSYTQPEANFINHHWLAGVIFYLLYRVINIQAVIIFHNLILIGMLLSFFNLLKKKSNLLLASVLTLPAILFFLTRLEVRPETFGYLFISLILNIIWQAQHDQQLKTQHFWSLIIIQFLWVNLHISFVFNFLISALWLIDLWFQHHSIKNKLFKKVLLLNLALLGVSLLNPNFITGLLEPLKIFTDYGYPIVENKSLFFLKKVLNDKLVYSYLLTILVETIIFFFTLKKQKPNFFSLSLAIVGGLLALIAKRNIIIFVLFNFPLLAENLNCLVSKIKININQLKTIFVSLSLIYFLFIPLILSGQLIKNINSKIFYLGFIDNQFQATDFFKTLNIKGHIFNNYDVGSLLIFTLYPEQQVFVDNRPEAYGENFFQQLYIPMQENDAIWQEALKKYNFQAIVFGARDLTNWGQTFIAARLQDPAWELVYHDPYLLIFVPKK